MQQLIRRGVIVGLIALALLSALAQPRTSQADDPTPQVPTPTRGSTGGDPGGGGGGD